MAGVRSIVSMKHVGLNVAADAAMTLAYTGVKGGMVIAVCDDPAMHSSQNEQDTRYFSVHSDIPLLDAGNPQEAMDMTREAFKEHLDSVGLEPDWVTVNTETADELVSIHNLEFKGPTRLLHRYLLEAGWVEQLSS